MKVELTTVSGYIIAPKGFRASGVFCDIKRLGTGKGSEKGKKRDLALIVSDVPATAAGMFTTNQACAADSEELASLAESLNRMATQLESRLQTVISQRNQMEAVLSSMLEGVSRRQP